MDQLRKSLYSWISCKSRCIHGSARKICKSRCIHGSVSLYSWISCDAHPDSKTNTAFSHTPHGFSIRTVTRTWLALRTCAISRRQPPFRAVCFTEGRARKICESRCIHASAMHIRFSSLIARPTPRSRARRTDFPLGQPDSRRQPPFRAVCFTEGRARKICESRCIHASAMHIRFSSLIARPTPRSRTRRTEVSLGQPDSR